MNFGRTPAFLQQFCVESPSNPLNSHMFGVCFFFLLPLYPHPQLLPNARIQTHNKCHTSTHTPHTHHTKNTHTHNKIRHAHTHTHNTAMCHTHTHTQ
jgi:hypothetical protein